MYEWLTPTICQVYFVATTAIVLSIAFFPYLRKELVPYGKLLSTSSAPSSNYKVDFKSDPCFCFLSSALKITSQLQVPKRFFTHFYLFGSFWNGTLLILYCFQWLRLEQSNDHRSRLGSGLALGILYQCHLIRRLYECSVIHCFGEHSRMQILHYILGLVFYFFTISSIWSVVQSPESTRVLTLIAWEGRQGVVKVCLVMGAVAGFVFCNWGQFQCHLTLARLSSGTIERSTPGTTSCEKKYALPSGPILFDYVVCPHYLLEVGIYLSLSVLMDVLIHSTIFYFVSIWTFANLSVVARDNYYWYERKFGKAALGKRRIMLPFVW